MINARQILMMYHYLELKVKLLVVLTHCADFDRPDVR
eukprot:COSAG02_NODE_12256_length_1572_cov_6.991622_2_plen_36_part_01